MSENDSLSSAVALIKAYLNAVEDRDLEGAKSCLGDGFKMIFPGGQTFHTLEQLIDWAAPRYRWVKKTYDRFDPQAGDDGIIVYCYGTLYGQWPDGTDFSDIRFIDRFVIRGGKLVDQMVWNDLAEMHHG
ncbi:MAG: nuclear transport factor 2 family protein [Rhodospirillales bacterium]|jgi:hypothetical protein|nr:hypothetical protein [Rhodospirillaceae bacterium]MDP6429181.1 nuclear transport factor 2 family protein [Rhodospirillales bacterium]MDP6646538.1 nuclear transport factor 2 family protein [Rhodospirillales bacterium]MDP6842194.1 nuclear transport factor 2 family protein [Rhodospirillales bacterium]|tara:strand:+ start:432 stop:821 length:390 start_codon:yes stop_codon:yes gene_type:complete